MQEQFQPDRQLQLRDPFYQALDLHQIHLMVEETLHLVRDSQGLEGTQNSVVDIHVKEHLFLVEDTQMLDRGCWEQ